MKNITQIKRILTITLSAILFFTSISMISTKEAKAESAYEKLEIEDMQLNKARIKTGAEDSAGKHVEVYWQQDKLDTFDKLTDITFARTVLQAEEAGEYNLQIHCKNDSGSGSITLKLFVNGTSYDVKVSGKSYTTVEKEVTMKKGKNTVVLAWVNWGYFDYINYPSELKQVKESTETKWHAYEAALNEIQLAPTSGFHNNEITLYTAPIEYNSGDEEWQGAVTFEGVIPKSINSIDLHYYVSSYNNGKAQLAMSVNAGKEVKLDLSGTKTNTELTYSISKKILEDAGFKSGEINKIKFRQASATGGNVGLYDIELREDKIEETTVAEVKSSRYEAEGAYSIAGARIKLSENDDESWSKGSYVGEFTEAKISKPSDIDEYCSNIGYIQYKVKADKAGYYKVVLGYATERDNMIVYATSGYEWSKVTLSSTGSWSNVGEASTYIYLKKGNNYIWVTGPAKEKDWVNYDYIDVKFDESAKIDTKKTVLLLDDNVSSQNSKIVDKEEDTTVSDNGEDLDNGDNEGNTSMISPKTGITILLFGVALVISLFSAGILYMKNTRVNR